MWCHEEERGEWKLCPSDDEVRAWSAWADKYLEDFEKDEAKMHPEDWKQSDGYSNREYSAEGQNERLHEMMLQVLKQIPNDTEAGAEAADSLFTLYQNSLSYVEYQSHYERLLSRVRGNKMDTEKKRLLDAAAIKAMGEVWDDSGQIPFSPPARYHKFWQMCMKNANATRSVEDDKEDNQSLTRYFRMPGRWEDIKRCAPNTYAPSDPADANRGRVSPMQYIRAEANIEGKYYRRNIRAAYLKA